MAGEATALAKPVMGTSVPAPAYRASRWYSPSAVSSTDRNTSVTEVAVAAVCCVSPSALAGSGSAHGVSVLADEDAAVGDQLSHGADPAADDKGQRRVLADG
jgi:hypothetical protein